MAKIPDFSQINIPSGGAWGWLKDWVSQVVLWGQTRDPANTSVGDPLDKFVARSELVKLGVVSRSSDGTPIQIRILAPARRASYLPQRLRLDSHFSLPTMNFHQHSSAALKRSLK